MRIDWVLVTALACIALAAIVFALGHDRAFWYDEVFTLGAASAGPGIDWAAIRGDVHPPTYPVLVHVAGLALGPDSHLLRLVNLPGLLALLAAGFVVYPHLGRTRTSLAAVLIFCSLYTLQLGLDLRAYALLAGFAALGQAALVDEVLSGRPRTGLLILSAGVLTSLHFFGAALGLSLLLVSGLRHLRQARLRPFVQLAVAGAVFFAAFCLWVFVFSDTLAATGGRLWIANGITPWLDFAAWQIPLIVTLFLWLAYMRSTGAGAQDRDTALWSLAPGALVLVAALLISMHTPVISSRNLVVLVPGLVLAVALALPGGLLRRLSLSPLVLILPLLFGLRYGDTAIRDAQLIRWAVERATPPECADAPLYYNRAGVVERYAQQVFLGAMRRPYRDFQDLAVPLELPPGCQVIGVGWHQSGTRAEVAEFFRSRGVEVTLIPPPDARLAASGLLTHGYVIALPDPAQ